MIIFIIILWFIMMNRVLIILEKQKGTYKNEKNKNKRH